jgi:hypothetical protein
VGTTPSKGGGLPRLRLGTDYYHEKRGKSIGGVRIIGGVVRARKIPL